MRVQFSIVGQPISPIVPSLVPSLTVELDVVPRVGDTVAIPGLSQGDTVVRTVVWYPWGDQSTVGDKEYGDSTPLAYVVVGQRRP